MRPPVTGALQHLRCRQLARGGITPSLFLVYKLPPTTDPPLSPSIARRIAIRGRAPAKLMSRVWCIMRRSPAASATESGGIATPSVRPQGAPRGRSRPRSRLSAGRSANARRSPVLRPSPTGIEGRRRKLQAPLSFGRRRLHVQPFARRCLILFSIHVEQNAGLAVIARPSARPDRAVPNGFGIRSERRSGLSRSGPHSLTIGQLIFGHWRIPRTDIERPFG